MNQNGMTVKMGATLVGSDTFSVIAGPCSIESDSGFTRIASQVGLSGADALRGGIFKMRTNPDSFQGLGNSALDFIARVKQETGLPLVSEVIDPRHIADLETVVDVFQVGSRNMYNYALLKELSRLDKPVLLKRGFSATIDEWLGAADYLVKGGNDQVILCERGIRSFESKTRNTLDLNAVAWIKENTPFPVIVDPSHAVGIPSLIPKLALASAAVGADGIIVEVHDKPSEALSDGFQALTPEQFEQMMLQLDPVLSATGRSLSRGKKCKNTQAQPTPKSKSFSNPLPPNMTAPTT